MLLKFNIIIIIVIVIKLSNKEKWTIDWSDWLFKDNWNRTDSISIG